MMSTPYLDLWANQEFLEKLEKMTGAQEALLAHHQLESWEPFRLIGGDVTDATGAVTLTLLPCPVGWECRLERYTISVGGASSAATVAAFVNSNDDLDLVDWASGLFGANPSRNVSDNPAPVYLADGEQFLLAVKGAVAAQPVRTRLQGMRRPLTVRNDY